MENGATSAKRETKMGAWRDFAFLHDFFRHDHHCTAHFKRIRVFIGLVACFKLFHRADRWGRVFRFTCIRGDCVCVAHGNFRIRLIPAPRVFIFALVMFSNF